MGRVVLQWRQPLAGLCRHLLPAGPPGRRLSFDPRVKPELERVGPPDRAGGQDRDLEGKAPDRISHAGGQTFAKWASARYDRAHEAPFARISGTF